jgi:hypothetical protein
MNTQWQKCYERALFPRKRLAKILAEHLLFVLGLTCLTAICSAALNAQTCVVEPTAGVRATHLLGFSDAKKNSSGTLAIQADTLQFSPNGKPAVTVPVAAVQDIFVGGHSRQVGGLPMTLGKAAVPFGGGRAISLFSRKKYDTLTVKYVDHDGGVHGVIFQLPKGQAENLRRQLIAKGAHVSEDTPDCKAAPSGGAK